MRTGLIGVLAIFFGWQQSHAQDQIKLENDQLKIQWQQTNNGYEIRSLHFKSAGHWKEVPQASGEYTYLYSHEEPAEKAVEKLFISLLTTELEVNHLVSVVPVQT